MNLKLQKRIAADVFKSSPKRVWFDQAHVEDIKEAITKEDIRALISQGIIREKPPANTSRARARKNLVQKRKGLRRGHGSRKGRATARLPSKLAWMAKVRAQRAFIKELLTKGIIEKTTYNDFYRKVKGGFFRSRRHIKLYMNDNNLAKK
ncbi:50S ribosomal protein L19e [Candidatus Woesearchaeota archaeon]|nr:MAG: 50S ribosomal protein L19e [Candidatus Woesearchaeota archaeon]